MPNVRASSERSVRCACHALVTHERGQHAHERHCVEILAPFRAFQLLIERRKGRHRGNVVRLAAALREVAAKRFIPVLSAVP